MLYHAFLIYKLVLKIILLSTTNNIFQELVANFNFHNYDNLRHTSRKYDPRGRAMESKAQDVVNLLFSAYNGDVTAMRRYVAMYLTHWRTLV